MAVTKEELRKQKEGRLGEENYNYQGCLMKIIEYNKATDIVVEFQDKYKSRVHTAYDNFKKGIVKNPYFPSVYGVGITGNKIPTRKGSDKEHTKEYSAWITMLYRCYNEDFKKKEPSYIGVTCCDEWLYFENFYAWLHSQENFNKWYNESHWHLDKDVIKKDNKIYCPEYCSLVPKNVNELFTNRKNHRGEYPIGVTYNKINKRICARCCDGYGNFIFLGYYNTEEEAFYAYKEYKEKVIKRVAQEEYDAGNITKRCYESMMNYEVEITD